MQTKDDDNGVIRQQYFSTLELIDKVPTLQWYRFRDLMNDFDFGRFESGTNRAFYKLWEILEKYPQVIPVLGDDSRMKTCHLAEAPGSFIKATRYKFPQCTSVGVSKRPRRPSSHQGNDGAPYFERSLYNDPNVKLVYSDLVNEADQLVDEIGCSFHFITADGGVDEGNRYMEKEVLHQQLLLSQINLILRLQAIGGGCVIKCFETFEDTTLNAIGYLVSHYSNYLVTKPLTSRPTNSERYIVCRDFKGPPSQLVSDLALLPTTSKGIRQKLIQVNNSICKRQIECIENITKFINESNGVCESKYIKSREAKKRSVYMKWCSKYNLQK